MKDEAYWGYFNKDITHEVDIGLSTALILREKQARQLDTSRGFENQIWEILAYRISGRDGHLDPSVLEHGLGLSDLQNYR